MLLPWIRCCLVTLLASGLVAAQRPFSTFFLLPDSNGTAGSESQLSGTFLGQPVLYDFTASQAAGENGYLTLGFDPVVPAVHPILDLHFRGTSPISGCQLIVDLDRTGVATCVSSRPQGDFPLGATVTVTAPVTLAGEGSGPMLPTTGVLSLSGTIGPGFYHRVVLLSGSVSTLPGVTFSVYVKEDAFIPNVVWQSASDPSASLGWRSSNSNPEPVLGRVEWIRDAVDHRVYRCGSVDLSLALAPALVLAAPSLSGGTILLDPTTRRVSGTLIWAVGGLVAVQTLSGDDVFSGPCTHPEAIHLSLANQGSLDGARLVLRRFQLTNHGTNFAQGLVYEPLAIAPPGLAVFSAASFSADPGINTPLGDVPIVSDALTAFSLTPGNGMFDLTAGTVPPDGAFRLRITVPVIPQLQGFSFFLGAALFDGVSISPVAASQPHRLIL